MSTCSTRTRGGFIDGTIKHGNNTVNIEDARVTQTQIAFRAPWSSTSKGRYTGHFDIQGITFDELSTGNQATGATPDKLFGDVEF